MRTRIFLTDQEREILFTEAQRIVRTGEKLTQNKLWHEAQKVLPAERQRATIYGSQISLLSLIFKKWQKTALGPQAKSARKPYTFHKLPVPATPLTPLLPFNYCPKCGIDLRTLKFV